MGRLSLEVADIFHTFGSAWRQSQQGHLSLGQLKVMSAIEQCRSAALGGHLLHCDGCDHDQVAYNSCRNRHCPKCQARAAKRWLQDRQADLLPVDYYHVVFTLPAPISAIAFYNKAVIYRLLFEVAAETLVYAKRPFAGPAAVLAYLSRYTHRVAISNSRLISMDEAGVTFRWKDYRAQGKTRHKTMTLAPDEFMRRFLLHVLPGGFHRIRHYGLIANHARKEKLALARELLQVAPVSTSDADSGYAAQDDVRPTYVCAQCGAPMVIVQTFLRAQAIRAPPTIQSPP